MSWMTVQSELALIDKLGTAQFAAKGGVAAMKRYTFGSKAPRTNTMCSIPRTTLVA